MSILNTKLAWWLDLQPLFCSVLTVRSVNQTPDASFGHAQGLSNKPQWLPAFAHAQNKHFFVRQFEGLERWHISLYSTTGGHNCKRRTEISADSWSKRKEMNGLLRRALEQQARSRFRQGRGRHDEKLDPTVIAITLDVSDRLSLIWLGQLKDPRINISIRGFRPPAENVVSHTRR